MHQLWPVWPLCHQLVGGPGLDLLQLEDDREAAARLVLEAKRFKILKDSSYVNVRPKAEVSARLLQTHLDVELQQLQHADADAETLLVSVNISKQI